MFDPGSGSNEIWIGLRLVLEDLKILVWCLKLNSVTVSRSSAFESSVLASHHVPL